MSEFADFADPGTVKAILAAREVHAKTTGTWVSDDEDDPAAEAEQLARDALEHLDFGRWDEALACAEAALNLAEDNGEGRRWREFALLVEEAAETGRASQS